MTICPKDAIAARNDAAPAILNKKMAEYSKAIVNGRPCFHISLVIDVSPHCDCHSENDVPLVPNVGMFASFDPVALDQACADACGLWRSLPCLGLCCSMKPAPVIKGIISNAPIQTPIGTSAWSTQKSWASAVERINW